MSDIKIQRGVETVSADGQTATLAEAVASLDNAFVVITGNRHVGSGSSTGNMEGDDLAVQARLTGTTTITFDRPTATPGITQYVTWEVWEYVGDPGGDNEFIVRSRNELDLSTGSLNTATLTNTPTSIDDCIPFINGFLTSDTGDGGNSMTGTARLTAASTLTVEYPSIAFTRSVHVTTVEFTGSNWSVGHGLVTGQTADTGTINLVTAAAGTGGSTFNVGDWSNAIIASWGHKGDATNQAIADHWPVFTPSTTSSVGWQFDANHDGSDDDLIVHVLAHPALTVTRFTTSSSTAGITNVSVASAGITDTANASVLVTARSSGTGTAYARGWRTVYLSSTTNVQYHCGRSGNTMSGDIQVINWTGVGGIVVFSVDGDDQLAVNQTDVVATGTGFGAIQGTGQVELGDSADYATATKVVQTIDSWSDTSIQFDVVAGGLAEGTLYLFVTNDAGDRAVRTVGYGFLPYDPTGTGPDHYWTLNNTYDDTGNEGTNPANAVQTGSPTFVATAISRSTTHSLEFNGATDKSEVADSNFTNVGSAQNRRNIGGWIQLDSLQLLPAAIYEEGGNVNNIYMIVGFGNVLLANIADSSNGFKVQAYSDFKLATDRPYHVMCGFDLTGDDTFKLWIDGVLQATSDGNPIASSNHATHSGDWSFGQPDGTLDTGGTDIQYNSATTLLLSNWGTWSGQGGGAPLTDTEIRDELFEAGAIPEVVIGSDTQANQQAAVAAYDATTRGDWPLSFQISAPTDGNGDLEITATDMVFPERASMHIRWLGGGTLTWRNSGVSNASIVSASSGPVVFVETAPVTVTVTDINTGSPIQNARVYLTAGTGGPLAQGTVILNALTNASGVTTGEIDYTADQAVTGWVRSGTGDLYQEAPVVASVVATGLNLTIQLIPDE